MKVKVKTHMYDTEGPGINMVEYPDGSQHLAILLRNIEVLETARNDFTEAQEIYLLDDDETLIRIYAGFTTLISFDSWAVGEATIVVRTKTYSEHIAEITPYTVTKTAYIDDTEITFTEVPDGNMSVFVKDSEGNYPSYTVERSGDRVTVSFEALKQITTVTISIL